MILKRLFALLLCFYCITTLAAPPEKAGTLNLSPFYLTFPATWTFDASKRPIEGHGPHGELLLITVHHHSDTSVSPLSIQDIATDFAKNKMPTLAAKNGQEIIRPVTVFPVPEGKLGFSAASEKSRLLGGANYFVQYLVASDSALIYLTFEGKGKASTVIDHFDNLMKTQQWQE
jgi:hypothetical protein